MKGIVRLLACVLLIWLEIPMGQAEIPFDSDFLLKENARGEAYQSYAVVMDSIYALLTNGDLYVYDTNARQHTLYARQLPRIPEIGEARDSELDSASRQMLEEAVFDLIGGDDELYGINLISGAWGRIDSEGIHWEKEKLDMSILRQDNAVNPCSMLNAFIEDGHLFAYYDMSWINGEERLQTVLLDFDLATGKCRHTEMKDTIAFCRYKQGELLLLQDDGSERPALAVFDIEEKTMQRLPVSLPVQMDRSAFADAWSALSEIGGMAYDRERNRIYISDLNGIYTSDAEAPFEFHEMDEAWDYLDPMGEAWVLKNGSYVFRNGSLYLK